MRRHITRDGQTGKVVEDVEIPDDARQPTIENRLAAIEQAVAKSPDFAAMKADLAASDVAAVDVTPAPKK